MIAIYDGSFEGFLTLIHDVYYKQILLETIVKEKPQALLFESLYEVVTDEVKAQAVLSALKEKFTKKNFERILNIFMCDSKAFEIDLLSYIIAGFKSQKELQNMA